MTIDDLPDSCQDYHLLSHPLAPWMISSPRIYLQNQHPCHPPMPTQCLISQVLIQRSWMRSKYIFVLSTFFILIVSMQLLIACRTAVVHSAGKDGMDVDTVTSGISHVAVQTDPEGCARPIANDTKQLSGLNTPTLQGVCTRFLGFCHTLSNAGYRSIDPVRPQKVVFLRSLVTLKKQESQTFSGLCAQNQLLPAGLESRPDFRRSPEPVG